MSRNKILKITLRNTYRSIYIFIICTSALWRTSLASNSLLPLKTGAGGTGVKGFPVLANQNDECRYDCADAERRLFCGSNGRTFDSVCRVNQSMCEDPHLTVTPGECDDSIMCETQRNYYQNRSNSPGNKGGVHIPVCTESGNYAPTQCNLMLEFCWCVTPLGKMIKGSTFAIGSNGTCGKRKSRNKGRKKCANYAQIAAFALKLRELIVEGISPGSTMGELVTLKHENKDRNKDGNLNGKEMKSLLRPYRKKLSRACVKVFMKFCDINNDRKISKDELRDCLGVKPYIRLPRIPKPEVNLPQTEKPFPHTKPTLPVESDRIPGTAPEEKRVCIQVRHELIRAKREKVIIPVCEGPNDKYWAPIQCYKDSAVVYCYCVVRETGTPIPQTSVENAKPDCKSAKLSADVSVPIPGCPLRHKSKLLKGAHALILKLANEAGALTARGNSTLSDRELAAEWYFAVANKNRDQVLTRKEIKAFKKLLSKQRVPKKCLRNFTQHCDRNNDKKITQEEFLVCLEVRKQQPLLHREISITINKLKTTEDMDNK